MSQHFFSRLSVCALTVTVGCIGASVFAAGRGDPQHSDAAADAQWTEPVVWEREYQGQVNVPDPSNWMVGHRLTGEKCTVSLRPGQGDDMLVRTSFWEGEKLAQAGKLDGEDFYLGKFSDSLAFILQTTPAKRPVSVALVGYDAEGRLVKPPRYRPRDSVKIPGTRECHVPF